jgi:hypothetical protein
MRLYNIGWATNPPAQFLGADGQSPVIITIHAQPLVSKLLAQRLVRLATSFGPFRRFNSAHLGTL